MSENTGEQLYPLITNYQEPVTPSFVEYGSYTDENNNQTLIVRVDKSIYSQVLIIPE